jgi:hypothetical protein
VGQLTVDQQANEVEHAQTHFQHGVDGLKPMQQCGGVEGNFKNRRFEKFLKFQKFSLSLPFTSHLGFGLQ